MIINHIEARIGDTVLIEPALTAYAERTGDEVNLYLNPQYRCLFDGHPHIKTVDAPFDESDFPAPSCVTAFRWAHQHGLPFGAGYFHQIGLQVRPEDRLHYWYFKPTTELVALPYHLLEYYAVIVPFARSCIGHQGSRPNIQPPTDWWSPILEKAPLPVISLGGKDDPEIPGTINIRNADLSRVMEVLRFAKVVISVETGLLHLSGGVNAPTVFLSSATPEWFAKPATNCEVIRASTPEWDHDAVLEAVDRLLQR